MHLPIGLGPDDIRNAVKNPPPLRAEMESGETPTLWIYHEIGERQTTDTIAKWIATQPRDKTIVVRINSYGGALFDGIAIYSALAERRSVVTRIDGIAASAASIIAMAGKPRQIVHGGALFIHRAWAHVVGNAIVMRDTANWLEKLDYDIAAIISQRSGIARDEALRLLDGDVDGTLFTAEEALALKLADVIIPDEAREPDTQRVDAAAQHVEPHRIVDYVPPDPPGGEGLGVEGEWERPNLSDFTRESWDALSDAERRRIASYFAFAFSLDRYSDLVLPHHYPPSDRRNPKASLNGVRNALARLSLVDGLNARDKERIEAHLRSHLPNENESSARDRDEATMRDVLVALQKVLGKGVDA